MPLDCDLFVRVFDFFYCKVVVMQVIITIILSNKSPEGHLGFSKYFTCHLSLDMYIAVIARKENQ